MTKYRGVESATDAQLSQLFASFTTHLTVEQLECLGRCEKGNSLRFEASEIVDALVAGGYAEVGLARVVTMTAKGHQYLQMHRTESRRITLQAVRRDSAPDEPGQRDDRLHPALPPVSRIRFESGATFPRRRHLR